MSWERVRKVGGVVITFTGLVGLVTVPEDLTKWGLLAASLGDRLPWLAPTIVGLLLLLLPDPRSLRRNGSTPATLEAPVAQDDEAERSEASPLHPPALPEGDEGSSAPSPPATDAEPRVFVEEPLEKLAKIYDDHIGTRATKLAERYIDKWVKISRPLYNAGPSPVEGAMSAYFVRERPTLWVSMTFRDKGSIERLELKDRGDEITVIGQIKKIEAHAVTLDNCELVY